MTTDTTKVIVTTEDFPVNPVHGVSVFHRDIPEVRGHGGSTEDAAARLVAELARALDSAPSNWRREFIEHAIHDVQAFAKHDSA